MTQHLGYRHRSVPCATRMDAAVRLNAWGLIWGRPLRLLNAENHDVIETSNHFRSIDKIIDDAGAVLSEKFIKELHSILKTGTSASRLGMILLPKSFTADHFISHFTSLVPIDTLFFLHSQFSEKLSDISQRS